MAALVAAIHVFLVSRDKDVDARHKAGHDDGDTVVDWLSAYELPGSPPRSRAMARQPMSRRQKPPGQRIASMAA